MASSPNVMAGVASSGDANLVQPADKIALPVWHGRGRPRKYNTLEERAAGHVANQQVYYDRNRDVVCRKVRRCYHEEHSDARAYSQRRVDGVKSRDAVVGDTARNDESRLEEICQELSNLTSAQMPSFFLAGVYAETIDETCNNPAMHISGILARFNKLEQTASQCAQKFYQKEGCTDRWKHMDEAQKSMQEVVSLLEDLLCSVMLGKEELQVSWSQGTLSYLNV
ncbi:hypothetical protein ARMSODRAFT_1021357 [Armillaria solidipes]|uniref:Uncharacterized protein n=1 Tax=Armillaria solidipes TaxID=1076256 RepID=A0A2H3BA61_9AGAR|nr:hypothetical protein ARMSODRAFT_1021357 [Armillaria solidipes]